MKVSSLLQAVELRDDKSHETLLGHVEVAADCSSMAINGAHIEFPWDEQTERAVAQYLNLPKAYLHRCDPEFRAATVNHWLRNAEHATTTVEYTDVNGEMNLVAMQRPDRPVMPLHQVGEIVARVFHPDDDIITLLRDDSKFHIDVATSHSVTVPPAPAIPDRRLGTVDTTRGGIRILATPHQSKPPIVQTYFHRLVCTNGMTAPRAESTIALRGKTVEEILVEMEEAASRLLGNMDAQLAHYADMANKRVRGNPATFAFRVAQENGIGARATERIMSRAGALPTDGQVSLYDVVNIFTEVAQSGMQYTGQVRLQEVAGTMTADAEATLNRCTSCEKPLDQ